MTDDFYQWVREAVAEAEGGDAVLLPGVGTRGTWDQCCGGEFEIVGSTPGAITVRCLPCGSDTPFTNPRFSGMRVVPADGDGIDAITLSVELDE